MTAFAALDAELALWAEAGRRASFWWRDDDAGADSPALARLLALAERHAAPLALAVIPLRLEKPATARIEATRHVTVLQHGLRHENRAGAGAKKCEFPARLPLDAMLAELDHGRALLDSAFDGRALPVLVPPWNRLAPALIPALASTGLHGLSSYGPRSSTQAAPGVRQVNCHVDPIDWRGTRGFIGEPNTVNLVCAHLAARRTGAADADEPTGLLSHHSTHDEACWMFFDQILHRLTHHAAACLMAPARLFPGAAIER